MAFTLWRPGLEERPYPLQKAIDIVNLDNEMAQPRPVVIGDALKHV